MSKTEWKECLLGDFIELHRGYDLTKSSIVEGPYPVVCSTSIMGYHNEFKVKGPGVVIGRSGTLGEVQYVDSNYWPHNTSLYVSDFKGNDPKFVKYFLQRLGTGNVGSGSAVPTLNRNHIQALKIKYPPLAEQQRIAKILSSLDDKIELNNAINRNLAA
jgi:type I restriction enzyme S subunit